MNTNKSLLLNTSNVVLVLDLDHTLAHYKDNMKGLYAITREMGISEGVTRDAIEAAEGIGFSFSKLYQILAQKVHVYMKEEEFLELAQGWFKENYVLYDDALLFLRDYLEHVPLVVITAGSEEFQREKMKLLDFIPHDVIVVPIGEPKMGALKSAWEKYDGKTAVFVEDNPGEFVHIEFDGWFGIACYSIRMRRADSPYSWRKPDMSDDSISSFDELRAVVPLEKEAV